MLSLSTKKVKVKLNNQESFSVELSHVPLLLQDKTKRQNQQGCYFVSIFIGNINILIYVDVHSLSHCHTTIYKQI